MFLQRTIFIFRVKLVFYLGQTERGKGWGNKENLHCHLFFPNNKVYFSNVLSSCMHFISDLQRHFLLLEAALDSLSDKREVGKLNKIHK